MDLSTGTPPAATASEVCLYHMNERSPVVTPIKRIWRVGLLAKDLAGVCLRRNGPGLEDARRRLVEHLGALHGLPQKIGQLLALAGPDGPSSFAPLTECRSSLPPRAALDLLEASLGCTWTDRFRSIDSEGIAASLGQVHRAVLRDGRRAAVKIQYSDSADNVDADLGALNWLSLPFGGLSIGFDMAAYRREVESMLRQELDYRREAQSLRRFGALVAGCEGVIVPEVIDDLSTDRVLTMTWLEGETFEAARTWPERDRRQAAVTLLRLFLTSIFTWRFLHADPHPGNYRFLRDGNGVRVGMLDFGCVVPLGEDRAQTLVRMIQGASSSPVDQVLADYLKLGFNLDLMEPMAHLLPALNQILFEPFITEGPFSLSAWRLNERVESLLGPFRWNFRFAGPADMIFVVRAYLGLVRYIQALGVDVDWSEIWHSTVAPGLQTGSAAAGKKPAAGDREVLSRHLRVAVWEAGQNRVELTFKAVLAESLPDLIPDELREKLRARRLDVQSIAHEAAERRFAPGELFRLTEGSKLVRVWLE
jgi:predicted unusual protein kinase regulating ubiquinone biosynthesis (AarF/ABC1/UbiB family)